MKKDSTKIDIEIYLVFIVLIGVSVFNAIYSTVIISRNQDASTKIMTVDVPSLQMLENVNLLAIRSKMYATNWVYLQSARDDKEKLRALHESEYPELKGELLATMTLWDNNTQQDTLISVFRNFDKLIVYEKQIMNSLVKFDDYEDPVKKFGAEEILESEILPRSAEIISTLNKVIMSRRMQADASHNSMIHSSRRLMWSVLGIAIMIVIVVLLAGFYLSNSIIVPVMKLKNYIQQMGKGEIPEINIAVRDSAVGQMTEAVKTLVGSVERTAQFANSIGAGDFKAEFQPLSKKDKLGNALVQMRESLLKAEQENRLRNWEATGIAEINQVLRENADGIEKLSSELLKTLAQYIHASCGGFYLFEENAQLKHRRIRLIAGYALPAAHKTSMELGEGFIGQAIRSEQVIHIKDIPQENFKVESGIGTFIASQLLIVPIMHQGTVYGAIEFSSFGTFEKYQVSFMSRIGDIIGSVMASSIANSLTKNLLQETQFQAGQLKSQEEKLRKTNEELSVQGELLRASKEELKSRNEDLKIKAELLQSQNERLEEATEALEIKAEELEQSSKYKSEFLANMSHELRTPLNSVLILAKLLAENKNKTLTEKEIEYAKVIHKSGTDLLSLINDILDLSKIEAGKIDLDVQSASIRQIKNNMLDLFSPIAGEKKIQLQTELHSDLPEEFITDQFRLEQVLKNLLSNALKFTNAEGTVTLQIRQADQHFEFNSRALQEAKHVIQFSVMDTGIGIPKEKQEDIFEAFQQADGSTSRKYGGTGLGLSISKMLVWLLGGEMRLKSEAGKGSTFYVFLPLTTTEIKKPENSAPIAKLPTVPVNENILLKEKAHEVFSFPDDRENLDPGDIVVLIAGNDFQLTRILVDQSHERKFKTIVTNNGEEALKYASHYQPSAILLDMQLQGMDSWSVLEQLNEDQTLCRIPVHIMSTAEKSDKGISHHALSYLRKPFSKREIDQTFEEIEKALKDIPVNILIVNTGVALSGMIRKELSKSKNCKYREVESMSLAKSIVNGKEHVDCMVVGIDEHSHGVVSELIKWKTDNVIAASTVVMVLHSRALSTEETSELLANPSVKVFDSIEENISTAFRSIVNSSNNLNEYAGNSLLRNTGTELAGKKVLIVDDNMRNIYSISAILEENKMHVLIAVNGTEALRKLEADAGIDIVLLDIMMPEMDGYEVLKQIRSNKAFAELPVIALTANALSETQKKCMESGASGYLSKPVNDVQLVNLLEILLSN